ncbi:hypothetical protein L484_018653 [Morus notabilis]|uniref:Uncharacterized protein n=1 Tax=Morus notabilis TaxID=981085 RepID=W9S9U0_9ROSA|nr:hypothetical protein L484_018653 [Morus notabilis]
MPCRRIQEESLVLTNLRRALLWRRESDMRRPHIDKTSVETRFCDPKVLNNLLSHQKCIPHRQMVPGHRLIGFDSK